MLWANIWIKKRVKALDCLYHGMIKGWLLTRVFRPACCCHVIYPHDVCIRWPRSRREIQIARYSILAYSNGPFLLGSASFSILFISLCTFFYSTGRVLICSLVVRTTSILSAIRLLSRENTDTDICTTRQDEARNCSEPHRHWPVHSQCICSPESQVFGATGALPQQVARYRSNIFQ